MCKTTGGQKGTPWRQLRDTQGMFCFFVKNKNPSGIQLDKLMFFAANLIKNKKDFRDENNK